MTPAEDFRDVAGRFGELVDGVRDEQWDGPTPVPEWRVRDVVGHLVGWFPALVHDLDVTVPAGPSVEEDPVGAWRVFAQGVQALLDDPVAAALVPTNPNFGGIPLDRAVAQFFTADVFMHTWDLARSTGQPSGMDPTRCEATIAGMEQIDQLLRDSGQYGPRVPVAGDAPADDRLAAFLGRDPAWTAESGPA